MPQNDSHRNNHYVPRFMIRYWEQLNNGIPGVFVHTLADNCSTFQRTIKRRPYPFAIVEDLYVPLISGHRAISVEAGWFNEQETALAKLVQLAHQRSDQFAYDDAEYTKISMALFALEQRSRFNLEHIRRAVEDNPEIREYISANPEREPHQLVLENLIHLVTEMHSRYWPLTLDFVHSGNESFILTDRPGFTDLEPLRMMVLTNKVAVGYQTSIGHPTYRHVDASCELVDQINKMLAIKARDWIIADNPSVLDRWVQINQSTEADKYCQSERIERLKPIALLTGFSIRPEL